MNALEIIEILRQNEDYEAIQKIARAAAQALADDSRVDELVQVSIDLATVMCELVSVRVE